jgi:acetyltransferase-like isoleucine patch superfamily enzyme
MNSIERKWHNWRNRRKLASCGGHPNLALPCFTVDGHLELGDYNHFRNNPTMRTYGEGRIVFGTRSGCSWGCLFEAHELVEIGRYVGIAEHCHITDTVYDFSSFAGNWRDAPRITKPVRIGEQAFIGSRSFIGPGVTIGDSAVITPHSVVLKDVGEFEIWGGAPARRMGHRTEGVAESVLKESEALLADQGVRLDRYLQKGERRGWGKLFNWMRK